MPASAEQCICGWEPPRYVKAQVLPDGRLQWRGSTFVLHTEGGDLCRNNNNQGEYQ